MNGEVPPRTAYFVKFELLCYSATYARVDDFAAARALTWQHVWTCPEGPAPWARPVEFHRLEEDAREFHAWVTTARGDWLNHAIIESPEEG